MKKEVGKNSKVSRRSFMAASGAAALGMTAGQHAAAVQPATKGRNIIFILLDDLRYDGFGLENPFFETPAIDNLAKNGVIFERAFITTSLCSPSRACTLTGQYAHKHGVLDNNTRLPEGTPTFPQELQKAGYRTGYIGKWHMGGSSDQPRPGFDRWVSFRGQGVYKNPTFNVDGEQVKREGHVTDLICEYAEEFIRKEDDRPFCLFIGHKAVHAFFEPPDRHKGSYANKTWPRPASMADTEENYRGKPEWVRAQRNSWHGVDGMYNGACDFDKFTRDYAETLKGVDDSVGRLTEVLREKGMLDSTMVMFTSDNGFQFGEHGFIDKRCMYEASIRVPLIVHCPELVKGGQRRREMVLNIDHAPTILEAAGVSVPETVQGQSFYGIIAGEKRPWRDAWLYEYFWERSFPQTPTVLGVRTDKYKLMQYHGIWDRYELYDLENDPDEMNNLLADFIQKNEGGPLDHLISRNATGEVKEAWNLCSRRLRELLEETGCKPEPSWS